MSRCSRVSVIIPTFNRAQYLCECLESVLAQSIAPSEIIVVDDGSKDCTPEIVQQFGPAVRYLRKENGGKPSALNLAIPELHGDYVWIFDDDDVALPDSIERRLEVLGRVSDAGFVLSGHYIGVDGEDGRIRRVREHILPNIPEAELRLALMKGCFVTMQSMLVRTDLLRQAGPFDTGLVTSEDYDMMLRLAAEAPFALLHAPTFVFRQHGGVRGPEGSRYEANARQRRFRVYDGVVGRKLRARTPLGAFLVPPSAPPLTRLQTVQALLARMEVMASKGLFLDMFADLKHALSYSDLLNAIGKWRLTGACRAAICTGYSYDAICDNFPDFLNAVQELTSLPGGRAAILQISAGLVKLAKSYPGDLMYRATCIWRAVRVAYQIAGTQKRR